MIAQRQTKKQNLDLALIGNSCTAALVDHDARSRRDAANQDGSPRDHADVSEAMAKVPPR